MIDEFFAFLAAGLIILAVLLVAFNAQATETGTPSVNRASPAMRAELTKTISMDISIRNLEETTLFDLGSKYAYNGIFFGSSGISYHADVQEARSATLSF